MTGEVDDDGTPMLRLEAAGREWIAIIDTGFNGELELPTALASHFTGIPSGTRDCILAGGSVVVDDMFLIWFAFDGETRSVEVSYAPVDEILLGTGLIKDYRLDIDFPAQTVELTRLR
jgi:predicted aspartyl protease